MLWTSRNQLRIKVEIVKGRSHLDTLPGYERNRLCDKHVAGKEWRQLRWEGKLISVFRPQIAFTILLMFPYIYTHSPPERQVSKMMLIPD